MSITARHLAKTDVILSKIIAWAQSEDNIRAVILIGSKAQENSCDQLSDYDISIFCNNDAAYTCNEKWLTAIGDVWVFLPEKIHRDNKDYPTRLVIFDKGVKIDFAFYSIEVLQNLTEAHPLPVDYNLGYQILVDKDNLTKNMSQPSATLNIEKPTEKVFRSLVEEFWFEAYHVAKYLHREDLWSVKFRDHGIKDHLLLKMIEWHAQATRQWTFSPHPYGKQMQSWVEKDVWNALQECFALFNPQDSWKALMNTIKLFRRLSTETAEMLEYQYPTAVDKNISGFIARLKDAS